MTGQIDLIQMSTPDETTLFAGKHISVLGRGRWEYVTRRVRRPAVAIVAITDDDRLVLVEQYRVPVGVPVVELPAGLTGDTAGLEREPLLDSAQRELAEETGYTAARWTELITGYSSAGLSDEEVIIFLAEGLSRSGAGGGVEHEEITVHEVPLNDVTRWLKERSAKTDFKIFAGLFAVAQLRGNRS